MQTIEYPPYAYVYMLAKYAPKAIRIYLDLWKLRDADCVAHVEKASICDTFGQHANKFYGSLRAIVDEQLASVESTEDRLDIHLVDYEDQETFYERDKCEFREDGPLRLVPKRS